MYLINKKKYAYLTFDLFVHSDEHKWEYFPATLKYSSAQGQGMDDGFEGNKYFSFPFQPFFFAPLIRLWVACHSAWMTSQRLSSFLVTRNGSVPAPKDLALTVFTGRTYSSLFTDILFSKINCIVDMKVGCTQMMCNFHGSFNQ